MLFRIFKIMILVSCWISVAHGELLIMAKDKQTGLLRVMTNEETLQYQSKINDLLLKYQWPMCIQSDLTSAEQAEYLAPGKPYAQEQFIHKKLQEVISPAEIDLQVMFVPDSFYELYCISERSSDICSVECERAAKSSNIYVPQVADADSGQKSRDILEYDATVAKSEVKKSFEDINKLFFTSQEGLSSLSKINNRLLVFIFKNYPELSRELDGLAISNALQSKIETLKNELCKAIGDSPRVDNWDAKVGMRSEHKTHIISKVMSIEYEARLLNKALLLRGTSFLELSNPIKHLEDEKKMILAGSTINRKISVTSILHRAIPKEGYSISYGTSLFAGYYQDPGACTYNYLIRDTAGQETMVGYGLLIDQQAYLQDGNRGLFYIPSLAPLTSLFGQGEYFHARSRVAVIDKDKVRQFQGIARRDVGGIIDPANIIIFEGDDIKHEEKFAAFLAKNGRIISSKNDIAMQLGQQDTSQKVLDSHSTVSRFLQQVRVLGAQILQRLVRIGDQEIPSFSEVELYDMLLHGATPEQYARLKKALSSMKREPVSKQLFNMSSNDLYETIMINRFALLMYEIAKPDADNITSHGLVDAVADELFKGKKLRSDQVNQLLELMDKICNDNNKDLIKRFVERVWMNGAFGIDSTNQVLRLIDRLVALKGLSDNDRLHCFDLMVKQGLLRADNVERVLNIITIDDPSLYDMNAQNCIKVMVQQHLLNGDQLRMVQSRYEFKFPIEIQNAIQSQLDEISRKAHEGKQSMRDFALHGTRGVSATHPLLMRHNPKMYVSQEDIVPSAARINRGLEQIHNFNQLLSQQQKVSLQKEAQFKHQALETQQRLAYERAHNVTAAELIAASSGAAKRAIRQSLPRIIR